MEDEPIPPGRAQWLWILVFVSMALLIVIWVVNTWVVESKVKPGVNPEGLAFPAKPGYEVLAPAEGEGRAPAEAPAAPPAPPAAPAAAPEAPPAGEKAPQ